MNESNKKPVENSAIIQWDSDAQLFEILRTQLFPAAVGDILDNLSYQNQFLPQGIKPVSDKMIIAGRAMPILESDYSSSDKFTGKNTVATRAFGYMFEALDDLQEHEIYIATGSSLRYALWGGLMSTRALKLAAAGAVLNGFHRDTNEILALNFPTFSLGSFAQDQGPRGKVIDWRVPIDIGGVKILPGDIIYGDRDGILVIPKAVETQAITLAWQKVHTENLVRTAIESGMSTVDAFQKFGVM